MLVVTLVAMLVCGGAFKAVEDGTGLAKLVSLVLCGLVAVTSFALVRRLTAAPGVPCRVRRHG